MYERQCQLLGCHKVAPGTGRFCGPEHKRLDYNARKREDRIRFNKAIAAELDRRLAGRKRGRPVAGK